MSPPDELGPPVEFGDRPLDDLLGYAIDRVTMDEAVERCRSFLEAERRPRLVVTVNAAIIALAERSERLSRVIQGGDLVLADGASIVWASRFLGGGLRHRVTGVDLMERLVSMADDEQLRLYFLGARPEVVRKVVDRVQLEYPGAVVAGFRDGYFRPEDWVQVIEQVRESQADVLFVAMPTPFKETWCADHLDHLGVPVVLPIGGAFDVFSGTIKRAPRWMQNSGLEWFWRLMMEPQGKWRRYLFLNSSFVWICFRASLKRRRAARGGLSKAETTD